MKPREEKIQILESLASENPSRWREKAEYRRANREELRKEQENKLKSIFNMTTLNEKAQNYSDKIYYSLTQDEQYNYSETAVTNAYIAGYTEALRWRDVNVELPILKEKVLVKNNNGVVDIACLWDEKTNTFYISQYGTDGIFLHFDYWRPIEII